MHARQRGDTIVEVLFAVTVFALIAVGSMAIMNQAMNTAQRALEVTLVRQQMDAQAEAIRYIHQAYVADYVRGGAAPTGTAAQWIEMKNRGVAQASEFGVVDGSQCLEDIPAQKPFILNARTAEVWNSEPTMTAPEDSSSPPFAQVRYNDDSSIDSAYGIWVEAVPSSAANQTGFIDFHIRACWESPGSSAPMTLGTIVRLYEPR